jgi:hypothetical protein
MQKTLYASTVAAALLLFGSEARAQANLHTADVVSPGSNMIAGEVAWPDFTFAFHHGISSIFDIGVKVSLIYGFEYRAYSILGLGVRVPLRFTPVKTGNFSFMVRFEPGIKFDEFGSSCNNVVGPGGVIINNCPNGNNYGPDTTAFGLWLPLGLDFGIHINRQATITPGVDMPFYVNLTNGVYGAIPILFGAAFEYDINDHIGFGANVKIGPSITTANVQNVQVTETRVGFITQGFFAYKF